MRIPTPLVAGLFSALFAACGPAGDADLPDVELGGDSDEHADGEDTERDDDGVDEGELAPDEEIEGDVEEGDVLEELEIEDGVEDGDGDVEAGVDESGDIVIDDTEAGETEAGDAATARPAATAITKDLRVLHWNIAGGKENGCRAEGITNAVVRYVRQHDVDFVGLNEVCPAQYRAIKEALRRHWGKRRGVVFSAYVGDGTGVVVGNAIFSRRRLDTISRQKLGHDQYGDRYLLCGRVAARKHLRFCSAHLTPGDATARAQLTRVHDRIESWWHDRKDTVILSGDLNLTPNDAGLNKVYAADANTGNNPNNHGRYRELDDDDGTHCRGYGERTHAGNGGPCGQGGKIDFLFARANRIVGDYRADTLAIPGDCTGACSDHRAVVGEARLRIRLDD